MNHGQVAGGAPVPGRSAPSGPLARTPDAGSDSPTGLDRGERLGTRFTARAAALAVMVTGLLVLGGWVLDLPSLKGPVAGLVQMKANAAIGLFAMGFSLLLLTLRPSRGRRVVAALAGGAAVLIGALTLAEYLLGHNLGIDELFFMDEHGDATVHPGRPAPQTAIEFLCLGTALVVLSGRKASRRVVDSLTGLAFMIALFAILGYAYG
ncbi:MAG TPA: hypothetical protein VGV10_06850, partial [Thermoleophilaceae bacterium]|nr:hypothetical protein [Thermoleophilaceae bacterium]